MSLPKVDIRDHNGKPCMFRQRQPDFSMWLWQLAIQPEDAQAFVRSGIDVFTFCGPSWFVYPGWVGPDGYDYSEFDEVMRGFVDVTPESALCLPRVTVFAPPWWVEQHPEECTQYANPRQWKSGPWFGGTAHESLASRRWLDEMGEALRRFVRHVIQAPYADRMLGIHVAGGIQGEWHSWSPMNMPDTSEPMRQAFIRFVRRQYANDEQALGRAWGRQERLAFDSVTVPGVSERHEASVGMFRDPQSHRSAIDYSRCHHEVTADAIDHFCRIVKDESERKLLTCVFYGYTSDCDWPEEGHHLAAARVLGLDSVDMLSSPHSYDRRSLGEDGYFRSFAASAAARGKLFIDEGDDRTHLAEQHEWPKDMDEEILRLCTPLIDARTAHQSVQIIRRQFGNAVTNGLGLWYMDQGNGWYRDDKIMAEIAGMKRWGDVSLLLPRQSVADVAVISSLESWHYIAGCYSGLNHVTRSLYVDQVGQLCRTGAPFDWFLIEDLEEQRLRPYKAYIFLDAFFLTDRQRAAVESLRTDGRTLLWFYAPGYVTDRGLSVSAMEELTGFEFDERDSGLLQAAAQQGVAGLQGHRFGVDKTQGPLFWPKAASDEAWALYADTLQPALTCRDFGAWRSVYCGVPNLSAALLREVYRTADVHIYCDTDDNIGANASWLCIHAASTGRKCLTLPSECPVFDVTNERLLGESIGSFEYDMEKGDTALFMLATPPAH